MVVSWCSQNQQSTQVPRYFQHKPLLPLKRRRRQSRLQLRQLPANLAARSLPADVVEVLNPYEAPLPEDVGLRLVEPASVPYWMR